MSAINHEKTIFVFIKFYRNYNQKFNKSTNLKSWNKFNMLQLNHENVRNHCNQNIDKSKINEIECNFYD